MNRPECIDRAEYLEERNCDEPFIGQQQFNQGFRNGCKAGHGREDQERTGDQRPAHDLFYHGPVVLVLGVCWEHDRLDRAVDV